MKSNKQVESWWSLDLLMSFSYNSVQMFEPFQDRNQHFFGTVSLSWIVMKFISKTYSFNLFWIKPLRKNISGQNLDFWKSYFLFLCWNLVFWTNMESNAAVTLRSWGPCGPKLLVFKRCVDLLVKNLKLFTKSLWINVKFFFCKYFQDQV